MIDEEDLRSRNGKSVGCWKQSGLQPWCWTGITGCSVCLGRVAISSWPPFVFGYESRLDARGHFSSWNNPGRIYSPYSAFCWTLCTGYCVFLKKEGYCFRILFGQYTCENFHWIYRWISCAFPRLQVCWSFREMATFQNRKIEASYGRRNRCGGVRTDGEACVHGARVRGFPRHYSFVCTVHCEAREWELVCVWIAIISSFSFTSWSSATTRGHGRMQGYAGWVKIWSGSYI